MQPQGNSITNVEYFESLEAQVSGCNVCADLQDQVNSVFASLQSYQTAINSQIALLEPILALLDAPEANPAAIVTWITTYIENYLNPMIKPYVTYATQLSELAAQVVTLTTAINNAASKIKSCTITIPILT